MDIICIMGILCIVCVITYLLKASIDYPEKYRLQFDDKNDYNPDDWVMYRLGDMFKGHGGQHEHGDRRGDWRQQEEGETLHFRDYPNSIASHHMRMTDKEYDYDTLYKIIKVYPLNQIPKKDELVVHLRVGDVLEYDQHSADEFLANYIHSPLGKGVYAQPLQHYENHFEKYRGMVNSVTLVAGGCRTTNFTKSKEYIQKIKEWFLQQDGIKTVNIRFREHPDDDFVYMVRSNHFIQSGGGFSALIGKLRDMR